MMKRFKHPAIQLILLFGFVFSQTSLLFGQKGKGWKLIWEEEFNYTGLPHSSVWNYEVGHIRNREQQYYTRARKENIWVNHGLLTITGRKELYPNENYKKGDSNWQNRDSPAQYTSASINTMGKWAMHYGRIEVKAKLPQGLGMWPAIWMMGVNKNEAGWPFCGEMDIMEYIGNHPKDIYGTLHFGDSLRRHRSSGSKTEDGSLGSRFHVYAMEWDDQQIDLFFDGIKYHHFVIDSAGRGADNPFRKPFYLLINLAMGASWPGPVDDNILPQQFLVDYIRVYQKANKRIPGR